MEAFEVLEAGDPEQVGRYRIVARLGAGGMGRVYLGRSPGGRAVAVKVVRAELAEDGDFRRRFAREVAAARRVNGVFTAGVVDADPEGAPAWLATAYVPGVPLGDAVAAHGPWPEGPVLALGAGLAEALEAIHAADVVHRDLKPSNILLAADGPRVIDFGISVAGEASALTRTGMVVGTPGFMSPEQLTGKPVGPAGDVFSLGAVLAFTATGAGPFGTGSAHALSFRVVYEEPDLRQIPPALRAVVARCLAKEPDQRPTVAALLHQLAEAAGGEQPVAHTPTQPGWLPEPVAASVHARTVTAPRRQAPPPALPETSEPPPPDPVPGERGAGPSASPAPTPLREQDGFVRPPPAERLPPRSPANAVGRPSGITRRRALLGLGGATVAGLGYVGWKSSDGGSSTREPDSAPTLTAPSGEQRWKFYASRGVYSSPAVTAGTVCVNVYGDLHAVDTATGKRRWRSHTGSVAGLSPAAAGGVVYISGADGTLHAVDAATGKRRWTFPTGDPVYTVAAVAAGVVYIGSVHGTLHAVDAATGKRRWTFPAGLPNYSSPAVAEGVVYVGGDGALYAVDTVTGKQRWKFPIGKEGFSSPAVADGMVYAGSPDGNLYAVDTATGRQRWKFPTGGKVYSWSAVADGAVYLGSEDGALYAVETSTGEQRWKFPIHDRGVTSPTVADGLVYVGSAGGDVYAVDTATGRQRWKFPTGSRVSSSPTVADGVVYAANSEGNLYAVTE
ncbi:PQQ-binding-like beta-propeller repeat protein [Streptomyces sp. NBC_00365]|uniref:outer membrane protein assembly factor BamB family protein n=1 Tax=Streptomyces sp. NBC_00365 TaxID=2975726 RepID=UPI00225B38C5|nr:PQQ-binding-like beta-propeller repeat protein [Streptomyces sp. NBC_00365]MCX5095013.1 PQQ-binding-like beta-propeller repeat protein [Streptomyces sp. NBC_00365]